MTSRKLKAYLALLMLMHHHKNIKKYLCCREKVTTLQKEHSCPSMVCSNNMDRPSVLGGVDGWGQSRTSWLEVMFGSNQTLGLWAHCSANHTINDGTMNLAVQANLSYLNIYQAHKVRHAKKRWTHKQVKARGGSFETANSGKIAK